MGDSGAPSWVGDLIESWRESNNRLINEYREDTKAFIERLDRSPRVLTDATSTQTLVTSVAPAAVPQETPPSPVPEKQQLSQPAPLAIQEPTQPTQQSLHLQALPATQEAGASIPACRHCEKTFDSKNKLHEHVRNCSASYSVKSSPAKPASKRQNTAPPATPPVVTPPARSPVTPAPATPPPQYRALSPAPPVYEKPKAYLTVSDLYTRYAALKCIVRTEKFSYATARLQLTSPANHTTPVQRPEQQQWRYRAVLTMQDLFNTFEKQGSVTAKLQSNSPAGQWSRQRQRANHSTPRPKGYQNAKALSNNSIWPRTDTPKNAISSNFSTPATTSDYSISSNIAQASTGQQRHKVTAPKQAPIVGTYRGVLRSHSWGTQSRRWSNAAGPKF